MLYALYTMHKSSLRSSFLQQSREQLWTIELAAILQETRPHLASEMTIKR